MNKLISLKNSEHLNIVNKINNFNMPTCIYVSKGNINKDIKINDYVYKNTYYDNYITTISGYVTKIDDDKVIITNDYRENILNKVCKYKIKNKNELIKILNDNYLQSIAKKINEFENIDNLLISAIDEEEYSVKEFIRLSQNYYEILETTDLLIKILSLKSAQLVTKNTNFKSIKNVKANIGTYPNIKITLVPDKYLIGRKEFLCDYLNIKGNTLMLSAGEIYYIYSLINGLNVNETLITISGNALEKGIIVNTKLGVSLKEILHEYVNILEKDYEIYVNGFFSGYKLNEKDLVIDRCIDYIVINKKIEQKEDKCINCGACNKICPFNINVKKCYEKRLNHKKCIGCGLCNYICPANINLKKIVKSDSSEKR